MATQVGSYVCQACGEMDADGYGVRLDNGEQFCPKCVVLRIGDGSMVIARSGDAIQKCTGCGETSRYMYCEECSACEEDHDGVSHCGECGEHTSDVGSLYTYCDSCHDDVVGGTRYCESCGVREATEHCCDECLNKCADCDVPINAHPCPKDVNATVIADDGAIQFDDVEIQWH